jgi:RNA polymerase sigma-70 factor (ECF subfamily)
MDEHSRPLLGVAVTLDELLMEQFEVRLKDCSSLVFRVAYSVVRQREDAEDVTQEVFVKAYRAFRQLRDRERFRAWVVRMTFRMALNRQRANRRRTAREQGSDGLVDMPAAQSTQDGGDPTEQLWRAIDSLSEKLRRVVVLASIEGRNLREVGLLLGVPEGTVKSRLFLARKELKERLS